MSGSGCTAEAHVVQTKGVQTPVPTSSSDSQGTARSLHTRTAPVFALAVVGVVGCAVPETPAEPVARVVTVAAAAVVAGVAGEERGQAPPRTVEKEGEDTCRAASGTRHSSVSFRTG